ncbi:MAG: hypothetical protein IBJ19_01845 [Gemmatimonadaceae bacterium]|nr:hypothetical protein [Gemmatimonadaceae bacterium]
MLLTRLRRLILPLLGFGLVPLLSACGSDAPPAGVAELRDLERAETLWRKRGFRNYRMLMSKECFCLAEMARPALVTVHGTTIVDVRLPDGTAIPAQYWSGRPVVDSLFPRIRDALRSDFYERVELRFDGRLGFPTRAAFYAPSRVADGDVAYVITGLTPLD